MEEKKITGEMVFGEKHFRFVLKMFEEMVRELEREKAGAGEEDPDKAAIYLSEGAALKEFWLDRCVDAAKRVGAEIDWSVYDADQMREIRYGLEQNIDVSVYIALDDAGNPVYTGWQMWQIRKGLEAGIDVGVYAALDDAGNPVYDYQQMAQIRHGLEDSLDVSTYADPAFSWVQMREIREELG